MPPAPNIHFLRISQNKFRALPSLGNFLSGVQFAAYALHYFEFLRPIFTAVQHFQCLVFESIGRELAPTSLSFLFASSFGGELLTRPIIVAITARHCLASPSL
jgi:hypothetical protein